MYNLYNLKNFDVLSIQMGKVGSTTILNSYPNSYQGHSWSSDSPIKYFSSKDSSSILGFAFTRIRWKIKFLIAQKRVKSQKPIKIIIGVREPISRNISGFFQSLKERDSKNKTTEELIMEFYCYTPHLTPLYWLDNEIKKNFNVDILAEEFNKERGYGTFIKKNISFFVYKIESLDNLTSELSEFLGKEIVLKNSNVSDESWHNKIYKDFKKTIKIPKQYINMLYDSEYMRKFYTDKEIQALIKNWSAK